MSRTGFTSPTRKSPLSQDTFESFGYVGTTGRESAYGDGGENGQRRVGVLRAVVSALEGVADAPYVYIYTDRQRPRRPERTDAVVGGLDFFRSRRPGRRVWPVGGYP